jgi:fatty-acyl-CoA synthase
VALGPTLQQALAARLERDAQATVCHFVSEDGSARGVTGQALLRRVQGFANLIGPARDGARKLVGVCCYSGLDLHAAFLGALWSGHVPTMLAPPSPRMEPEKYERSFRRMLGHLKPDLLFLDAQAQDKLEPGTLSSCACIDPSTVPDAEAVPFRNASPGDIALVQHSSGTTGLQKGVALSHAAILDHHEHYSRRLGLGSEDVVVSWLPLYHDMGFVACFLLPLIEGVELVELSPFDWVRRPVSLFEQITRHRGTLCWLPNFAFSFLASSVRRSQLEGLDLTSIRAWINCSEPVRVESWSRFKDSFAAVGVSESQHTTSYAMAENVFAVTQSEPGSARTLWVDRNLARQDQSITLQPEGHGTALASNGRPLPSTEVVALGENDLPLEAGTVGELAIRGSHRFHGYFRRDDLTQAAVNPAGWFRTGDIGFLHDGEVYVSGRKKDLIIIAGRNLHPEDVEDAVNDIKEVNTGRVVAFGLPDARSGTEKLVVLAELALGFSGNPRVVELSIRKQVAQTLDMTASVVRVVPPRWLVKSTSGKVARGDSRRKYLAEFVDKGAVDL